MKLLLIEDDDVTAGISLGACASMGTLWITLQTVATVFSSLLAKTTTS